MAVAVAMLCGFVYLYTLSEPKSILREDEPLYIGTAIASAVGFGSIWIAYLILWIAFLIRARRISRVERGFQRITFVLAVVAAIAGGWAGERIEVSRKSPIYPYPSRYEIWEDNPGVMVVAILLGFVVGFGSVWIAYLIVAPIICWVARGFHDTNAQDRPAKHRTTSE